MKKVKIILAIFGLLTFYNSIIYAQSNSSRFSIAISGGYAVFSPDEVNSYMQSLDRPEIKGGIVFGGNIGFMISSSISLNLKMTYSIGKSQKDFPITGEAGPGVIGIGDEVYRFSIMPVGIGLMYHLPSKPLRLNFGAFVDYNFGKATYQFDGKGFTQNFEENGSKSAVGFHSFIAPEFVINSHFSLLSEIGYRFAKIEDIKKEHGFIPIHLNVDFGGVYFLFWVRLLL